MLEKIVAMLGASPTQYRLLLKTEKLVEKRALEGRSDLSNMSLAVTCVFGFIISVLFTFMPFVLSMDTFTFSLIGIHLCRSSYVRCHCTWEYAWLYLRRMDYFF